MPGIFISYRRTDSQDVAGRVCDRLVEKFSRDVVFKDVDSIPLAVPFPQFLLNTIRNSEVVLVVIGPTWCHCRDDNGQIRLNDPEDIVRMEVETALRLGKPTIPVTVSNARIPNRNDLPESLQALISRNGQAVRPDPDFHRDMDRLIHHLGALIGEGDTPNVPALDQSLLRDLLELVNGWYNEVVNTAAQIEHASNSRESQRFQFLYVNTRNLLPKIVSIRNTLPNSIEAITLAREIDRFVQILTYIHHGAEANSYVCRPALFHKQEALPNAICLNDEKQLLAIQSALQMLTDEITRLQWQSQSSQRRTSDSPSKIAVAHPKTTKVCNQMAMQNVLSRLESLQPQCLLDRIVFIVGMPPEHIPSFTLTHAERCLKVLQWAVSASGPGLQAIEEELR